MSDNQDLAKAEMASGSRDPLEAALDSALSNAFRASSQVRFPAAEDDQGKILGDKYELVEMIGEGGMGTVWRARQIQPVDREVAVKLIKKGMDSKQILARFETERQAIAMMDHAHIAKILDGGMLSDGRPYFVMELVRGLPITQYCDQQRMRPRERLELLIPVCQAIHHAHQKGIIHRDIKPSNVLVAHDDDRPVPKVIDFGIAKATGNTLSAKTLVTGLGSMIGTPEYMSPEQAQWDNLDIDTRSDVYSLGVLLYELLTGAPPFSRDELERQGLFEMLRIVRETEPRKPSTRVASSHTRSSLAEKQSTDPETLSKLLKKELDWIVMKALEKDRSRRYESAFGLAADIRRFLVGEPVLAHPPSKGYQLRKVVARNRGVAIVVTLLFLSLFGGIAGTTWGLIRARVQQKRAEQALVAVDRERQAAETAREEEQQQRVAAERAREEEKRQRAIAETARAQEQRQREEAERNAELARQSAEAARIAKEAETTALQKETLERKKAQSVSEFVASYFFDFTAASRRTENDTRINPADRNALIRMLDRGTEKLDQRSDLEPKLDAQLRWTIGLNYQSVDEQQKAASCFERAIQSFVDANDQLLALYVRRNWGDAITKLGDLEKAAEIQEENLREVLALFGPDHTTHLIYLRDLAITYRGLGRFDEAEKLAADCLERSKRILKPDDEFTRTVQPVLASILLSKKNYQAAIQIYDELYQFAQTHFDADDPRAIVATVNLAQALDLDGQVEKSTPLFENSYAQSISNLGADDWTTIQTAQILANAYSRRGQKEKAIPLLEAVLAGLERQQFRSGRSFTLIDQSCRLLEKYEMLEKAEAFRRGHLAVVAQRFGPDSVENARSLAGLGNCLRLRENWPEAQRNLADALSVLVTREPKKWLTAQTSAALGMVYVAQERFAEARTLLEQGITGMLPLEPAAATDQKVFELQAMGHLIACLKKTATESPDIDRWQKEHDRLSKDLSSAKQ